MAFWNDPTTILPKQAHRWVISFGESDLLSANTEPKTNAVSRYFAKSVERPSYELPVQDTKILYSHTIKFPKRVVWKPITIVFYDAVLRNSQRQDYGQYFNKENKTLITKQDGDFEIYEGGKTIISGSVPGGTLNIEDNFNKTKVFISSEKQEVNANRSTQVFFYNFLQQIGYSNPDVNNASTFKTYNFKNNIVKQFNKIKINELDETGLVIESWNIYNPIFSNVVFDKLDYSSEEILKITVTVNYDWAELQTNDYGIKIEGINEYQKKINMRDRSYIEESPQQKKERERQEYNKKIKEKALKEYKELTARRDSEIREQQISRNSPVVGSLAADTLQTSEALDFLGRTPQGLTPQQIRVADLSNEIFQRENSRVFQEASARASAVEGRTAPSQFQSQEANELLGNTPRASRQVAYAPEPLTTTFEQDLEASRARTNRYSTDIQPPSTSTGPLFPKK